MAVSIDVVAACLPGDVVYTRRAQPYDPGARPYLLLDMPPKRGQRRTRVVPFGAQALVISRPLGDSPYAFVLCDGALGWLGPSEVGHVEPQDGEST